MSFLLALAAAAAYGAADFLGGLATRRAPSLPVVFASQGAALVLVLLAAPLVSPPADATSLLWGATAGVAYGFGLVLLYRSLARGRMSVVAPITGVCALGFPALFGVALGERPGVWALVGIVLAGLAVVLVSRAEEPAASPRGETGRGRVVILMAVAAGVGFGLFLIFCARTSPAAGLWPLAASRVVAVSGYGLMALTTGQSLRLGGGARRLALAGGALDVVANTFYVLAVRGAGAISLAATLTALYPAATVLLASLVLRERVRGIQAVGLALAGIAAVLITSGR